MDEKQDIRNGVMDMFGLAEGGIKLEGSSSVVPKKLQECEDDYEDTDSDDTPIKSLVTDDTLYEAKGDTPTVGQMLKVVIENSKAAEKQNILTPEERNRINETCIDEQIIADLLG